MVCEPEYIGAKDMTPSRDREKMVPRYRSSLTLLETRRSSSPDSFSQNIVKDDRKKDRKCESFFYADSYPEKSKSNFMKHRYNEGLSDGDIMEKIRPTSEYSDVSSTSGYLETDVSQTRDHTDDATCTVKKQKKMDSGLCQVCGDAASGFYCGAFVCEACKKFYMRAVKQEKKFVCLRDQDCVITRESRVQCQYCRYQKCMSLNMYSPGSYHVGGRFMGGESWSTRREPPSSDERHTRRKAQHRECKLHCPSPFRPDNFGPGTCCQQPVFSYQIAEIGGSGQKTMKEAGIANIPCRVCGAPSSGYHFGALTCEGCKGFFRRMAKERRQDKYVCLKNGGCQINTLTRNLCKACRFQKCLDSGMSQQASRIGRQPNSMKHAISEELKNYKAEEDDSNVETVHSETQEVGIKTEVDEDFRLLHEDISRLNDSGRYDCVEITDDLPERCSRQTHSKETLRKSTESSGPQKIHELTTIGSSSSPSYHNTCRNTSCRCYDKMANSMKSGISSPDFQMDSCNIHTSSVNTKCSFDSRSSNTDVHRWKSKDRESPFVDSDTSKDGFSYFPTISASTVSVAEREFSETNSSQVYNNSVCTSSSFQHISRVCRNPTSNSSASNIYQSDSHKDNFIESVDARTSADLVSHDATNKKIVKIQDVPVKWKFILYQSPGNLRDLLENRIDDTTDYLHHPSHKHIRNSVTTHQMPKQPTSRSDSSVEQWYRNSYHSTPAVDNSHIKTEERVPENCLHSAAQKKRSTTTQKENEHSGRSPGIINSLNSYNSFQEGMVHASADVLHIVSKAVMPQLDLDEWSDVYLWEFMMSQFHSVTRKLVKLVKKIPGFQTLQLDTQATLLQSSMYPMLLICNSGKIDEDSKRYDFFGLNGIRTAMIKNFPMLNILEVHVAHAGEMNTLMKFNPVEIAYICALLLFTDDKVCPHDSDKIKKLQETVNENLLEYQMRTHSDGATRYGVLLVRIPELQLAGMQHNHAAENLIAERKELKIPRLYKEMFFSS